MPSYTPRSSRHPYLQEDDKELWDFYIKEFRRLRLCSTCKMWEDFLAQHGKKRLVWSSRRASGIESHFRKVLIPRVLDSPLRGKDLYDIMKFYKTKLDKTDIKFLEKREAVKIFTDEHGCFLKAVDVKTNEVINEETFDRSRKGSLESDSSSETVARKIGKRFLESDRDSSYDETSASSTAEVEYRPLSPKKEPTSPRRQTRSQHISEVVPTQRRELRGSAITPRAVRAPIVDGLKDQIDIPTSPANSTRVTRSKNKPEVSSPTKRRLDSAKDNNNNGSSKISPSKPTTTTTGSPKKKGKTEIAESPIFEKWNDTLKANLKAILNGKLDIADLEKNLEIPEQYQEYFDMPVAKAFLRLALKGPRDPEAIPMNLLYQEAINSS